MKRRACAFATLALLATACADSERIERLTDPDAALATDLRPLTDLVPLTDRPCEPAAEVCNGLDDDCDGLVDDADPDIAAATFDDAENCGACGEVCTAPNGEADCRGGACVVSACEPGFSDYNGDVTDGCESDCQLSEGGAERCDAVDNDCDGVVDEGWALESDRENCGACDNACPEAAQGNVQCVSGACALVACEPGFVDADAELSNGCEYACLTRSTPEAVEFCNGLDDDCDTRVDEAPDLAPPSEDYCGQNGVCAYECVVDADCGPAEVCNAGHVCVPSAGAPPEVSCAVDADCQALHRGLACVGVVALDAGVPMTTRRCVERIHAPLCDADAGYRCARPPEHRVGAEVGACDGLDNDCDGRTDEDFVDALFADGPARQRVRVCAAGEGACRVEGRYACTADALSTACTAVALAPETNVDDDCDGEDDDCDGTADEDFADAWVRVGGVEVFAFEASRPGATADAEGRDLTPDDAAVSFVEGRACSRAGVRPWANVSWAEADAACRALGARLCSGAEWALACGGPGAQAYPYGAAYQPNTCNGGELDADPRQPGDQDAPRPTGSLATCARGGIFDLSGNLKEWTADLVDGLRPVRGGGYESNIPAGLACGQTQDLKPEELRSSTLGFRCCR